MRWQKITSAVLHPVVMPTVGVLLYFILTDLRLSKHQKLALLAIVFIATYIIPVLLLIVLKAIGGIKTYNASSIEERKVPVLFMLVLFYFVGKTLNETHITREISYLFYGTSFGLSLTYMLFITKLKTSLHLLSIGSALGFFLVLQLMHSIQILPLIVTFFILAGILASARLYLKAHTASEVYLGFFIGIICQFIAFTLF